MRRLPRVATIAVALGAASCGSSGHPPTPRIALAPAYLPIDDGYQTDLVLDGTTSRDDVDDPERARPLKYRWEIEDPAPKIVAGALDASRLTVRVAAAHPTTVHLTVSDEVGDSARATARVGVTNPK